MKTIHAIYKGGIFQPLEKVELPEDCEVEFEPRPVNPPVKDMADIFQVLSQRFASGQQDVASRHNEHQP